MSSYGSRKRYKDRKAKRLKGSPQAIEQPVHAPTVRRYALVYDQLADPAYNLHVVGWRQAELETYDLTDNTEEEGDGWLVLRKWGANIALHYNHRTRKAWWEGFDAVTEFFIRDIEQYITTKFSTS